MSTRSQHARRALRFAAAACVLAALSLLDAPPRAYGVLSHEALVDAAWTDQIEPLLRARYPGASPAALTAARGYAYGGCLIQDMGYYPFGSRFFTDVLHYVRSGEFIEALVANASDVNELAFALGALAHYAADSQGHSIAINRSVPLQYPKLRRKYGDFVTYEDKPSAHIRVEFALDVLRVARGRYVSQAYVDFIGFQVATPLLERTFRQVYCLELKDVFGNLDLAVGTYRRTASRTIPRMTELAWESKKDEILASTPDTTRERFVYVLARGDYEKQWGTAYRQPGPGARFLEFLIRILPKVGPLKALAFRFPTPQEEALYEQSFDASMASYRATLEQVRSGRLHLEQRNLDTGEICRRGHYRMADEAFDELLARLERDDMAGMTPELRAHLLAFYEEPAGDPPTSPSAAHDRLRACELARLGAFGSPEFETLGRCEPAVKAWIDPGVP